MKIKELIERLRQFDGDLDVAAYLDQDGSNHVYEIADVPREPTVCSRHESGGITFPSPKDPNGVKVLLLELDEA